MPNYFGRAIFVGNLSEHVRERDLEDLFYKFGRIVHIDLKRPARPPYFAFVEFSDPRDAEDASRRRDGVEFMGARLRCEVAKGGDVRNNHRPVNNRTAGHRVMIKGLPRSASWQDLKDHFRPYVKPIFTEVQRDQDGLIGIAEFETYEDMKLAIRKCDDSEFKNAFDKQGTFIRVMEDTGRGGGGGGRERDSGRERDRGRDRDSRRSRSPARRSKSRSRSRSRSRSKSPAKSRSPAASKSPVRDASRSRSRSRSVSRERSEGKDRSPAPKEDSPARE